MDFHSFRQPVPENAIAYVQNKNNTIVKNIIFFPKLTVTGRPTEKPSKKNQKYVQIWSETFPIPSFF